MRAHNVKGEGRIQGFFCSRAFLKVVYKKGVLFSFFMANLQINSGMQTWRQVEILVKAFNTSTVYLFLHAGFVLYTLSYLLHCSMTRSPNIHNVNSEESGCTNTSSNNLARATVSFKPMNGYLTIVIHM